jgi:carbonic anhydrase
VPPELVFDQGLGALFIARVAGNIFDDAVNGSVEYAVEHLGAELIVVMGHESCGAVKAAIDNNREAHIRFLAEAIKPAIVEAMKLPGDKTDNAVRANVE